MYYQMYDSTLVYLIAEQAVISEQDRIFQKIVKLAGHNKQAGWNILENLISKEAEFHTKTPFLMHFSGKTLVLDKKMLDVTKLD